MNWLRNPELLRNVWLELTPQRLLAMPLILSLVFLAVYLADHQGVQILRAGSHIPQAALIAFGVITILWGAKLAGDAIADEFIQGTWDTQRLSGLSAWQMSAGKLLGGPIFAWYGGAICALVALAFTPSYQLWHALRQLLTAAGVALSVHAVALMSGLMMLRKLPRQATRPRARSAAVFLVVLVGTQVFAPLLRARTMHDVQWYGQDFSETDFALLCTALAVCWSVLGLYRSMRAELAFRDPPLAWLAFLLFLYAFSGGFFYGPDQIPPASSALSLGASTAVLSHLALCIEATGGITYLLLFGERKDWVRLRRLAEQWKSGQRTRALALMPLWLVSAALCVILVAAFCLLALLQEAPLQGIAEGCTALALLALLVRDAAIVLGLNFTTDQRRADAAAGIYVALLYLLLPWLLSKLGLEVVLPAVMPFLVVHQPVWLVACLFEAAAALEFVLLRWRKLPR